MKRRLYTFVLRFPNLSPTTRVLTTISIILTIITIITTIPLIPTTIVLTTISILARISRVEVDRAIQDWVWCLRGLQGS